MVVRGGGDKPGEYTISHAPLHSNVNGNGNGQGHDEESEAPSSPTMTEAPVKAHTMPAPGSNPLGDAHDRDRHVAFAPLEVNGLDEAGAGGRFMDAPLRHPAPTAAPRVITESPLDTTKPIISRGFTASPASGSVRLPESPIVRRSNSAQASPILKPSSGPTIAGLGHSPLAAQPPAQVNGHMPNKPGEGEQHVAFFNKVSPAKADKTVAEKVADRTVMEELTSVSRESGQSVEVDSGATVAAGTQASALPANMRTGDKSETATLDGLPIGAIGPGATLGSMESEVPEGKGTKRLYKMSKMFSESTARQGIVRSSSKLTAQTRPVCCLRPGRRSRTRTSWTTSGRTSCTSRTTLCRSRCAAGSRMDVSASSMWVLWYAADTAVPGHHDIRNPQNAAWLAGFRYAKRKVFV